MPKIDNRSRSGQVLAGVVMLVRVLLILVPALVRWIQIDSLAGVKTNRTTLAFNLAEAGIERGAWKVKGSSGAFNQATTGTAITGYNNDTTYADISGGTYRITLAAGGAGNNSFTVTAEGRDVASKEVRAQDREWQVAWSAGVPTLSIAASSFKCQEKSFQFGASYGFTENLGVGQQ